MATVYGSNANKIFNSDPIEKADVGDLGGRVRCAYDKYTLSADLSAADIIIMGRLPKGAKVVGVKLNFDALGAGTLDVGWQASDDAVEAADPDGFIDGAAVTSAGSVVDSDAAPTVGIGKEFAAEVRLAITVATDTSATSGDVELFVYYLVD